MEGFKLPVLRVLKHVSKPMQRLGYLKRLVKTIAATETSSLEKSGNDLINTVLRKVNVPLTDERANYIKIRLYDRVYKNLKTQTEDWLKNGGEPPNVLMEMQDLYLADPQIPSQVGKLVKDDSYISGIRNKPRFHSKGTFSITTRAITLLSIISENQQKDLLSMTLQ